MSKIAFAGMHSAGDFGNIAERVSRICALFAVLRPRPRTHSQADTFTLAEGRLRYLTKPKGRLVTCAIGSPWLTFDGDAKDVILETGESYRCESEARLGISAFEAAVVRLA